MKCDKEIIRIKQFKNCDVAVVGGGLAGICSAIAAARCGAKVVLIHDRPVLGGNASSEVRVSIAGATRSGFGSIRYAAETGIIHELELECMHRCPSWDASYYIRDIVYWEAVKNEPNIELLLNSQARRAITDDQGRITAVEAVQTSTGKEFLISGRIFIDASGDGMVAADAGAEFKVGREAKREFDESMAPDEPDEGVMGSTIMFIAKNMGHKVTFVPPEWAYDFPDDKDLPFRDHNKLDCVGDVREGVGFWWIEHGGLKDTVYDNEEIRDELIKIMFGVWDHLKNHGDHGLENHTIVWMNTFPAKRESRRFTGDYTVNENDVKSAVLFNDRVAYAGWPIDVHTVGGIFSHEPPSEYYHLTDIWNIPLRCLYSKNVPNLFMAGRNISATRIALGSARVMATCALMGQAAGTAAYFCIKYGISPRQLYEERIKELQQELLKNDAYIKDIKNEDTGDIARNAEIFVSSENKLSVEISESVYPLDTPRAQLFPLSEDRIDYIELFLESQSECEKEIELVLRRAETINNFFISYEEICRATAIIPAESKGWTRFYLNRELNAESLYWILIPKTEGVFWHFQKKNTPVGLNCAYLDMALEKWKPQKGSYLFRMYPESRPYSGKNLINGATRPEKWTNIWISDPDRKFPQTVELDFKGEKEFNTLCFTFDTDLDTGIYLPAPWGVFGVGSVPTCVRDYNVFYYNKDEWVELFMARGNYQRHRIHRFNLISTSKLLIEILAANGDPAARIYEIRCYNT